MILLFLKNKRSQAFSRRGYISCGCGGAAQSSSILCSFCIPFLSALFSITLSTSRESTFNYIFDQHTHSQYLSLEASHIPMEWKYGKNQPFFWGGGSPKFYSCCLSLASSYFPTPALCVRDYEEQIFFREEMKGLVSCGETERERPEISAEADNGPVSIAPSADPPSSLCKNPHAGHITARLHQCLLAC